MKQCCLLPPAPSTPLPCPHPHSQSDLSNAATSSASEYHSVAPVVIGSHGGQAILLVHKQGHALYSNRASQWLVEVLPTEVIVDLQGLWEKRGETLGCPDCPKHLLPESGASKPGPASSNN